jgi:ABC-type polysaccharide/polyol phosphate transport system ATPase subunit
MIRLDRVHRRVPDLQRGHRPGLRGVTAVLPQKSAVGVIGDDRQSLTAFLHLVAGSEVPDRGGVFAGDVRRSPIVNAGGTAASCLVPQMSALANIRALANLNGVDPITLAEIVESACRLGPLLDIAIRKLDVEQRRSVEASLIAALPYDYYLVDRMETLPPPMQAMIARSARARGASLVFTTLNAEVLRRHGRVEINLRDGKVSGVWRLEPAS